MLREEMMTVSKLAAIMNVWITTSSINPRLRGKKRHREIKNNWLLKGRVLGRQNWSGSDCVSTCSSSIVQFVRIKHIRSNEDEAPLHHIRPTRRVVTLKNGGDGVFTPQEVDRSRLTERTVNASHSSYKPDLKKSQSDENIILSDCWLSVFFFKFKF